MQQETQQKSHKYKAKLIIENNHSQLIQQVLSVDIENTDQLQLNSTETQLEMIFQNDDPKKVRASIKHTLDQLLLVLETIKYAKK